MSVGNRGSLNGRPSALVEAALPISARESAVSKSCSLPPLAYCCRLAVRTGHRGAPHLRRTRLHSNRALSSDRTLVDNSLPEPLADVCADEGRYEFMLTINPLRVIGGTGSPANPIAVF